MKSFKIKIKWWAIPSGVSKASSYFIGQADENMSQGGASDNTAHLKGKLNNLVDTCRMLHEQLNTHKKEV